MHCELKQVVNIRFGTSMQPSKSGNTKFLQLKNFNAHDNQLTEIEYFADVEPYSKLESQLLRTGDVLLAGKGSRYFAWYYREEVGQAIASNNFLILHPRANNLDPRFLTLFLNLPQTIDKLNAMSIGTSISSIKKEDLLELTISVPSLDLQRQIVKIGDSHRQQIALLEQLIKSKEKYYSALISQLTQLEK